MYNHNIIEPAIIGHLKNKHDEVWHDTAHNKVHEYDSVKLHACTHNANSVTDITVHNFYKTRGEHMSIGSLSWLDKVPSASFQYIEVNSCAFRSDQTHNYMIYVLYVR